LITAKQLQYSKGDSTAEIAVFNSVYGKRVRVLLANDGVGNAPNMTLDDGSDSDANKLSDMEFYALGCYLCSKQNTLPKGRISESPPFLQQLIFEQWLQTTHPKAFDQTEIDLAPVSLNTEHAAYTGRTEVLANAGD